MFCFVLSKMEIVKAFILDLSDPLGHCGQKYQLGSLAMWLVQWSHLMASQLT